MKKWIVLLTLVLCAFVAANAAQAAEKIKIGLVVETLGNPYFATMKAGAEAEAAKHPNVELTVLGALSGTDLAGMTRMIEDLIQKRVHVLSFNAIDPQAVIPTVQKAQKAGIPVLIHSDDLAKPVARHFIGPDQYRGQYEVGKMLVKMLGGKGKVAVLEGVPGNMANVQRKQGLSDAFKDSPGIKVVGIWAANYARDQGLKKTEDILTAHPDVDAIAAINDDMALGALQAVKARGKVGKIIVTGFNGVEEAIQEVYRGNMAATVLTYADEVGREIVRTGMAVAQGKDDPKQYSIDTGTIPMDSKLLRTVGKFLKVGIK